MALQFDARLPTIGERRCGADAGREAQITLARLLQRRRRRK
jgi:hypothetical protein